LHRWSAGVHAGLTYVNSAVIGKGVSAQVVPRRRHRRDGFQALGLRQIGAGINPHALPYVMTRLSRMPSVADLDRATDEQLAFDLST
jgi:hypothetical protein